MEDLKEAWQQRSMIRNQSHMLREQIDDIMETIDQLYESIIHMEEQVRNLNKRAKELDSQALSNWTKAVHKARGGETHIAWSGNDHCLHNDCELSTGEKFEETHTDKN